MGLTPNFSLPIPPTNFLPYFRLLIFNIIFNMIFAQHISSKFLILYFLFSPHCPQPPPKIKNHPNNVLLIYNFFFTAFFQLNSTLTPIAPQKLT